ncbi:signal transduction histidine kinase [Stackebrandtia albiflava]|uniref:histidine kinase n=1 Tax=Stackebrandtia albiflava TaxID=406432 RepID=A0A562V496_9ACTN|nr:histidine kinase [Stackebrandtia albiflava]TWJ12637.1 signal transduction histidine kinase [Stackebrandtia albiflava]
MAVEVHFAVPAVRRAVVRNAEAPGVDGSRAAAGWWSARPGLEWLRDGLLVSLPLVVAGVVTAAVGFGADRWWLPAAALFQSAALVLCRRYPLPALVAVAASEAALAWTGWSLFVAVLVAAIGLGRWGRRGQRRAGAVFGVAVPAVLSVAGVVAGMVSPWRAVVVQAVITVVVAGCWWVSRWDARRRGRLERAEARARERERRLVADRAAVRERELLAAELHDLLDEAVAAIVADAESAAVYSGDDAARSALWRVARTGRESLAELRRLLRVVGPERDAASAGLAGVDRLVAQARGGGRRVRLLRCGRLPAVPVAVERVVFRVVAAGLAAAPAGDVSVSVTCVGDGVSVRVRSGDVVPPDDAGEWAAVRERVRLLGGDWACDSTVDGVVLSVLLPVRRVAAVAG